MAHAYLVIGLAFGDEGKGLTVAHLTEKHKAKLNVRFNGGAQAAHNVVSNAGVHHMFSQFGSGSFTPGCRTLMSRETIICPGSLLSEGMHLRNFVPDAFDRMHIEENALVGTRFQMAANRIREMARGKGRHGSCGMGINETVQDADYFEEDALHAGDLVNPVRLREKLEMIQQHNWQKVEALAAGLEKTADLVEEVRWLTDKGYIDIEAETAQILIERAKVHIVNEDWLDEELAGDGTIVFEGAQGVLLDQFMGFMPHCTRSTTTFNNAYLLMKGHLNFTRVGVLRTYLTRHGAGPMPSEDPELIRNGYIEAHNEWNVWQNAFRAGHFDHTLLRYAIKACGGVDEISLTHCDKTPSGKVCTRHSLDGNLVPNYHLPRDLRDQQANGRDLAIAQPVYENRPETIEHTVARIAKAPVAYKSYGPSPKDVR
jgi:adenylosuccinate synthase